MIYETDFIIYETDFIIYETDFMIYETDLRGNAHFPVSFYSV